MTRILFTIFFWILIICQVIGQTSNSDTCHFVESRDFEVYIPGSKDSHQENGIRMKLMDLSELAKGFRLVAKDPDVTIIGFSLTFDSPFGTLYAANFRGDKADTISDNLYPFSLIAAASIVSIDRIYVRYHDTCFKVRSQAYFRQKRIRPQSLYTLKKPLVCHDGIGFLRCFADEDYLLSFANGEFIGFRSLDSLIHYSHQQRVLAVDYGFLSLNVKLLKDAVELKVGERLFFLTSDSTAEPNFEIPMLIERWESGGLRRLSFWLNERHFRIHFHKSKDELSWEIVIAENEKLIALVYNGYKKNRLSHLFINDDISRSGMSLSTTFRSLKKIWRLRSLYVDTLRYVGDSPVIGSVPLENPYEYWYDKSGRLKLSKTVSEMRKCECDKLLE